MLGAVPGAKNTIMNQQVQLLLGFANISSAGIVCQPLLRSGGSIVATLKGHETLFTFPAAPNGTGEPLK